MPALRILWLLFFLCCATSALEIEDELPAAATWTTNFVSAEEATGLLQAMATPGAIATARPIDEMRVTSDVNVTDAVAKRILNKFQQEISFASFQDGQVTLVMPASVIVGGGGNTTDEHVDHRLSAGFPDARGTAFVVLQAPPGSVFKAGGAGFHNVSVPYSVGTLVQFSEGVAHSSSLPAYSEADGETSKLKLLGPFDVVTFERVGGDYAESDYAPPVSDGMGGGMGSDGMMGMGDDECACTDEQKKDLPNIKEEVLEEPPLRRSISEIGIEFIPMDLPPCANKEACQQSMLVNFLHNPVGAWETLTPDTGMGSDGMMGMGDTGGGTGPALSSASSCSYQSALDACKAKRRNYAWTCEALACSGEKCCGTGTKWDPTGKTCVGLQYGFEIP